jgi:Protein of unknown function (DUF4240)
MRALLYAAVATSGAALGTFAALGFVHRHAEPTGASAQTVVVERVAPATVKPAQPRPEPTPASSREPLFWQLIEQTRRAAGNDTGRQSGLLKDRLTQLSPSAILQFERTRRQLDRRAYTWAMLGAASVIEDGCSDDCFRDFRAYVISLGRGPYMRALRNGDSLASVARDAENGDWENADDVAPDAYSSVTGNDFPYDEEDVSGPPAGRRVDLSGPLLRRRYPRLAARFRGN